jgi:amino acid transporter
MLVSVEKQAGERKLGTFLGVYTPTILTILGVIMYLRFGWLVGHLGLFHVLLIVILANAITAITTLSFSAVATNARVGAGGAYFIISRSLGIELGGSIGVPLFLSQACSVTLYAFGLAESLRIVWPGLPVQLATVVIIAAVGALAFHGAERALRAQLPMLVAVGVSLVALAAGALGRSSHVSIPFSGASGEVGFWVGFAVFFPAVTGIMAGLGLSGDLRDAARAIPVGSLLAVATGFAVYLAVPFLLAAGANPYDLRNEPLVWTRVAALGPWLVLPGLWAAIFSSAVGSILTAPRTLQALARDGLAPRRLRGERGSRTELLPGLGVSLVIATLAVFLGGLNAVATIVSMFFLTVYGTVNLVAAFEALSGDPSWRPRLRVPWPVSLTGGFACAVVMFLISPTAGIIAIVTEAGLWLVFSRRAHKARWGDARRGLYEILIRWALIRLSLRPMSPRNWRPHVLVFVDDPVRELDLIRFGNWFSQGRGVVTACHLVVGDLVRDSIDIVEMRNAMKKALHVEGLVVFPEVDVVKDVVEGIVNVSQANGMAGLSSNTVLLGWPSDRALQRDFLVVMRELERLNKSIIFSRLRSKHLFQRQSLDRSIIVWWGGLERNGDLMLLLAYLLKCNPSWRNAKVRVKSIASSEVAKTRTDKVLEKLIADVRIEAQPEVTLKPKDVAVGELIAKESAGADVVFLGLATPKPGEEEEHAKRLDKLAGNAPAVFFVKNASLFTGDLLESPEEEFAKSDARDSVEDAEKERMAPAGEEKQPPNVPQRSFQRARESTTVHCSDLTSVAFPCRVLS